MKTLQIFCLALASLLASCSSPVPSEKIINSPASIPESFALNKLKVINTSINRKLKTMSTLYGNEAALARAKAATTPSAGESLTLVTWQQKPDENWFGANIPGKVAMIEKINILPGATTDVQYEKYVGEHLTLNKDTAGAATRIAYILQQHASELP